MSILLTGGCGFIGSITTTELIENNKVIIFDNLVNSKKEVIRKIRKITGKKPKFIRGDLLDYKKIESVFKNNKIKSVIHFAGLKAVGESITNPLSYYENNVSGTINLLKAMEKYDCKNLVFSSSATVYSPESKSPLTEEDNLQPINPYGMTKLYVEQILKDLHNTNNNWNIVILRYFNPVGSHKSGLIGENPNNIPNNIVPVILDVIKKRRKILTIFGDNYPTFDGTCIRDYIHVVDLAKAHVLSLKYLRNNKDCFKIYNIGTGIGYTVIELLEALENELGGKIPYKIGKRREGDKDICFANSQLAERELGWIPQYNLKDMCKDIINYSIKK